MATKSASEPGHFASYMRPIHAPSTQWESKITWQYPQTTGLSRVDRLLYPGAYQSPRPQ